MSFSVTVLGYSGMFATRDHACSGYLIEVSGQKVWMDAGAGTWQQLLRHTDYRELAGVVMTHRHPDHTTDVLQCFHARHYGAPDPMEALPVWTTRETIDRILGFSKEAADAFDLRPIGHGDTIEIAGATFSFHAMAHPPETVGVRIEAGGGAFAYSSDTGPGGKFDSLASGADIFLCEATFQGSESWEGHLSAAAAGAIAAEHGAKRLVLTHLPPGRDHLRSLAEARAEARDVPVMLAEQGLRLEVRG